MITPAVATAIVVAAIVSLGVCTLGVERLGAREQAPAQTPVARLSSAGAGGLGDCGAPSPARSVVGLGKPGGCVRLGASSVSA